MAQPTPVPARDRFSTLPVEVATPTFKVLGMSDLKRLRLTSHTCSSIAEPILFRQVVIAPYAASMAKLDSLASHERLRLHVQEIAYDLRKFFIPRRSKEGPAMAASRELMKTYIGRLNAAAEVALLARSFTRMPALNSIKIRRGDQKLPGCLGRALEGTLLNGATLSPLHGKELNQRCANIILAAHTAAHIQKYDGPWLFPAPDGNEEVDFHTKKSLYLALANLKQMSLSYSVLRDVQSESSQINSNWTQHQDALANIVSSNNVLEHLSLRNSHSYTLRHYGPQFTFGRLFGDCTFFPRLQSLNLCSFKVSQAALEAFLASHSSTLKLLDLVDIELVQGGEDAESIDQVNSWPTFFHFLRKEMSLDVVWLEGWLTIIDEVEA